MGFRTPALIAPKPGETGRGPQLKELCALALGNNDRLTIASLGCRLTATSLQQIALHPQQLSFKSPLLVGLDDSCSFVKAPPSFIGLIEFGVGFGKPSEHSRRSHNGSNGA